MGGGFLEAGFRFRLFSSAESGILGAESAGGVIKTAIAIPNSARLFSFT
jgi:hypothetical protein